MSDQPKPRWDKFKSRFIDTPFFSADRKKTIKALRHLWERMPAEEMEKLPAQLMVFAFSDDTPAVCVPRPLAIEDASADPAAVLKQIEEEFVVILLAASLELKSQQSVDHAVAHEFAHALRRGDAFNKMVSVESAYHYTKREVEVDDLVNQWGFKDLREREPERELSPGEAKFWTERRGLEYFTERLAEPELVKRGIMLDVEANQIPFAVPVGKVRRGGNIEFLSKREAQKAFKLLSGKEGFPNLEVITCRSTLTGKPMRYYELWWGDPPPSSGGNGGDPMGGLLLGVYYGYRSEAIADHVKQCQAKTGKVLDRKTILALIEKARNP